MKIIILIILFLIQFQIDTQAKSIDCENSYKYGWYFYYKNKPNEAIENYKKLAHEDYKCGEGWEILLGAIFFKQGNYDMVLNVTEKVRPKIEKAFKSINKDKTNFSENEIDDINFLYYRMIGISGSANYFLKNYSEAIKDLVPYVRKNQIPDLFDMIGISYYENEQYRNALEYFKESFQLHKNKEAKDLAAYNIGAMYAKINDAYNSIFWLEIPLGNDRKIWLEKVEKDKDFNGIRSDEEFKNFIKQQKNLE